MSFINEFEKNIGIDFRYLKPNRLGRIGIVDVAMIVYFATMGFGLYSLVTGFSFGVLIKWVVIGFVGLLIIGFILPDWSDLEDVQKVYESLNSVLDQPGYKLYREEVDRTMKRAAELRDRVKKAKDLVKEFPAEKIRKDIAETKEKIEKGSGNSESISRLESRLRDLQETLARMEEKSRLISDFFEMKKTWIASLAHLRVQLEGEASSGNPREGDEVLEELSSLNRIAKMVEEGKGLSASLNQDPSGNQPPTEESRNAPPQSSPPTSAIKN